MKTKRLSGVCYRCRAEKPWYCSRLAEGNPG